MYLKYITNFKTVIHKTMYIYRTIDDKEMYIWQYRLRVLKQYSPKIKEELKAFKRHKQSLDTMKVRQNNVYC